MTRDAFNTKQLSRRRHMVEYRKELDRGPGGSDLRCEGTGTGF